jgi:hypothetical protein
MNMGALGGQESVDRRAGQADSSPQFLPRQVPLDSQPIELDDFHQHEVSLDITSREVNNKMGKNGSEVTGGPALPSVAVDRTGLARLLKDLRVKASSDAALGRLLGLSSNHIPRLLADEHPSTPSVETCLHVAIAAARDPGEILRAAGHGDVVDVLERAYRAAPAAGRAVVRPTRDDVSVQRGPSKRAAGDDTTTGGTSAGEEMVESVLKDPYLACAQLIRATLLDDDAAEAFRRDLSRLLEDWQVRRRAPAGRRSAGHRR